MDISFLYDELNLDGLTEGLNQLFPEFSIDVGQIFDLLMDGKIKEAAVGLVRAVPDAIMAEAGALKNLALTLLILGILSALLANFMQSFENHQIADIAHYFSYLLLLSILIRTFQESAQTAMELIERILLFVKLFMPTFMLAVGVSTGSATAFGYYQLIILLITGLEELLLRIGLPCLNGYMLLTVIGGIWEEERLQMLIELVKNGVGSVLKFLLTCITSISLLQSMVTPILDQLKSSTAVRAASAIPGIGNLAEGTAQLLLGSAVLVKNCIGVVGFLLLLLLCLIPLGKMLLYACILKGCAALLGMVADKRLAACADRTGDGAFLLLKLSYTAAACFLIMTAVITCLTGRMF